MGGGPRNYVFDDNEYDLIVNSGECLVGRYTILKPGVIGKGSFGQVVFAHDMLTNKTVAIKIIKSKKSFTNQAKTEIELLDYLNKKDPTDAMHIVRMIAHFMFRNHLCIVFEKLSDNLYTWLLRTKSNGISLPQVRDIGRQLLVALQYIGRMDVIHCDLKPENIMLCTPDSLELKVIDFGSSCLAGRRAYTYIQSRFYRSPEVILGDDYDRPIDMWSLGCVLVEMHTGAALFEGRDSTKQLAKIYEKREQLAKILGVEIGGPGGRRKNQLGHSVTDYRNLCDLILKMLEYDPTKRITPLDALKHPFFTSTDAGAARAAGAPVTQVLSSAVPVSANAGSPVDAVPDFNISLASTPTPQPTPEQPVLLQGRFPFQGPMPQQSGHATCPYCRTVFIPSRYYMGKNPVCSNCIETHLRRRANRYPPLP